MKLHYLHSQRQVVKAATIIFNGVVQRDAQFVDDEAGTITRRTYGPGGLVNGTETLTGKVVIILPAGVRGGPYRTKET